MRSSASTFLAALSLASAKSITVEVGEKGLTFDPNTVTAAVGDVVEFKFYSSHSVIQGSFDSPCSVGSVSNGFASGVVNGQSSGDGDVFKVTVNSTDPIYYYCGVPSHCQAGMVGAINPSSADTVEAYQSSAASTKSTTGPSDVQGGVFGAASGGDDDSSSSSSASSSSASSSASATDTSATSASSTAETTSGSKTSSAAASATSSAAAASTSKASAAAGLNEWISYSGLIALTGGLVALMA